MGGEPSEKGGGRRRQKDMNRGEMRAGGLISQAGSGKKNKLERCEKMEYLGSSDVPKAQSKLVKGINVIRQKS